MHCGVHYAALFLGAPAGVARCSVLCALRRAERYLLRFFIRKPQPARPRLAGMFQMCGIGPTLDARSDTPLPRLVFAAGVCGFLRGHPRIVSVLQASPVCVCLCAGIRDALARFTRRPCAGRHLLFFAAAKKSRQKESGSHRQPLIFVHGPPTSPYFARQRTCTRALPTLSLYTSPASCIRVTARRATQSAAAKVANCV